MKNLYNTFIIYNSAYIDSFIICNFNRVRLLTCDDKINAFQFKDYKSAYNFIKFLVSNFGYSFNSFDIV